MTSAFSWQNSISLCPASFHIPRPNLPVTPGVSWLSTFAFQSPIMKRTSFWVLLLKGLVGLHKTIQLQFFQCYWLGHRLGSLWYWMACFGDEQRCISLTLSKMVLKMYYPFMHGCCCSVTQSRPILCYPMDCSMPGLAVHHQLPELTQILVLWVGDAIQPSHPLSPSPFAFSLSQHQGLFQWVGSLHQVAKVLELQRQHQSFQWIFRTDFL